MLCCVCVCVCVCMRMWHVYVCKWHVSVCTCVSVCVLCMWAKRGISCRGKRDPIFDGFSFLQYNGFLILLLFYKFIDSVSTLPSHFALIEPSKLTGHKNKTKLFPFFLQSDQGRCQEISAIIIIITYFPGIKDNF